VARALFLAALALTDRSTEMRQQGHAQAATSLDQEAKDRLMRALESLQPTLARPEPALPDLFLLGRCREALFRLAERLDGLSLAASPREYQRREQEVRDPFVAITARDMTQKDGVETLGLWGRAAQVALEHFRWMNLHAGFVPKPALESIKWENTRAQ
jgi:hypothetical protein